MRQRYKVLISFISIFFLFSVQIISFSPISVKGEADDYFEIVGDQTIGYDWLTFSMAEDNDDYLRHNIGGVDLIDYESLDSEEAGENTLEFMSKITFGYEMNSYLALALKDVFYDLKTNAMSNPVTYAHIREFPIAFVPYISNDYYGKFTYSYVDNIDVYDLHNDFHDIPVTIGINPTFSALDGKVVNGITIKTSEFFYEVKVMDVVLAKEGTCGDYTDLYTTQEDVSKGVDTTTLSDDIPTFSQQFVIDHIEELDLGWKTGMGSNYFTDGITITELLWDSFSEGESRSNPATGDLTYIYPIRLQPELSYGEQRIDVRYTFFSYDPNGILYTQPIQEFSVDRVISTHVKCPFVHLEYETTVYLICNVELDAEIYESALDDPFFRKGDWLWNPIINSYDPTLIVLPTPLDDLQAWWDEWGWLVILVLISVAGIYLFIQIGMPLILKKQAIDVMRRR